MILARFRTILAFCLGAVATTACGDDRDGGGRGGSSAPEIQVCTTCGACTQSIAVTSAQHVDGHVDYPDPPPAGGDHNPCWAPWGVHTTEVATERFVHNLEHGGVVVLYHCPDGCPDDAAALGRISDFVAAEPFALMSPYSAMTERFAIVSWGRRVVSDCIDDQAVAAFYAVHVNHAPESIPDDPDPSCGDGTVAP